MLRSWKLCTAFGIGIHVHWTFLFLPAYMFVANYHLGASVALFAAVSVLAVFVCVALHELGHALMARVFGIQTRDITLLPIGGVARLERMSEQPWEEFWISVAGPAVNVVILLVLALYFFISPGSIDPVQLQSFMTPEMFEHPIADQALFYLMFINGFLVVFNMLPIFPMDGGRVLRAILASWMGHLRATEVAVALSIPLAILLGLFGLIQSAPLPVLVAVFIFFAGQQELMVLRWKARQQELGHALVEGPFGPHPSGAFEGQPIGGVHVVQPAMLLPPEPNFSGFTFDARSRVWIEWREGRPIAACLAE